MSKLANSAVVRPKILQIGLGRFGFHLNRYLKEACIFDVSLIKNKAEFDEKKPSFKDFDYVFLAVPDSFLEKYIGIIPSTTKIVHFSGFYYNPNAVGVHPVQSFSKDGVFDLKKIEYVIDGKLDEHLIKLFFKTTFIKGENKKKYHTYLSTAANSLQLLVNQLGEGFEKETKISKDILKKIIIQSLEREKEFGESSFSGPWTRREDERQFLMIEKIEDSSLKNLSLLFKKSIEKFNKEKNSL